MPTAFLTDNAVSVTDAVSNALEVATSCMNWVLENPIMLVCFGACLVPIGFRLFAAGRSSVGA